MQARIEELEHKLGVFKAKKKKNKSSNGGSAINSYSSKIGLSMPMNLEREELIVLGK